jgi:16S rRNA G966 N2-methylase RsmD
MDKIFIARQIKNISFEDADRDMDELMENGTNFTNLSNISSRCLIGNKAVDYFTFLARLETKGKYNINFFEFVENIESFKKKKFIQNMLTYYREVKNKNNTKNEYVVLKEVYNICISAINIMKPLNCMEIYKKYNAKRVLNFCAGWGGSTIAAAALKLDAFYGIEINQDLKEPYEKMVEYLKIKSPDTKIDIRIEDALETDYSTMCYDLVFSSPPYYALEKYPYNHTYASKREMDDQFYKPIFEKTYNGLQEGGHYVINICREVYENVLINLLGEADESFPLKKSKRQNNHVEMIYVWKKL